MSLIGANILIVDDSLTQVRMLREILEGEEHKVFVSYDGVDIIKNLVDKQIHIVLLDIILPKTDGFELLKIILGNEKTKDLPIIMVTGLTEGQNVKKALDMGAFDYIKKPIDPIETIARVNSALRLKHKQDLLKEFLRRDHLTKLFNRSHFDKILPELIDNVNKYELGISLAIIDCDFFKRINDVYGHIAGDTILCAVANAIDKSIKGTDVACRYGGDEFCMILLNTSLKGGLEVCERVRQNIRKMKFVFDGKNEFITVTIGIAHLEAGKTITAEELIREADIALYLAKNHGRNKTETLKNDIY